MLAYRPRVESLEARDLLSYTLTDLGTFGHFAASAVAINDAGQVAISAADFDGMITTNHALLWRRGSVTELSLSDATDFHPAALSSDGTIAGAAAGEFPFEPAMATICGGNSLGFEGAATGVNRWQQAVGLVSHPNGPFTGFLWQHGELTDLGLFGPNAINDAGEIAGNDATWQDGVFTPLPLPAGAVHANGTALNDLGEIVGNVYPPSGQPFSGYWDDAGFHFFQGYPQFTPTAVNDAGQIVGRTGLFENGQVYTAASLVPTGWRNVSFNGINDNGVIVGTGQPPGENAHAFMLRPNPVPLPAPWLGVALMYVRHSLP